jgi:translation initiation factor 1
MSETCAICGLPKELCVCKEISKSVEKIQVYLVKKRKGKFSTIITGFDESTNLKELATELKKRLACGGTAKENHVELQGDHRRNIKEVLLSKNYKADQIDVR